MDFSAFQDIPGLFTPEMAGNVRTNAMLGAATGLLNASGYSSTPHSIFADIGKGAQGYLEGQKSGTDEALKQLQLYMAVKKQADQAAAYKQFLSSMPGLLGSNGAPPPAAPGPGPMPSGPLLAPSAPTAGPGLSSGTGSVLGGLPGFAPGETLRDPTPPAAPAPSAPSPATVQSMAPPVAPPPAVPGSVKDQSRVPPIPQRPDNPANGNFNKLLAIVANPDLAEGPRKAIEALMNKAIADGSLTEAQKDYTLYYNQARAGGDTPKTFEAWDIARRQAAASTNNIDLKGETAESKALGEGAGARANATITAAANASKGLVDLANREQLLKNLETGKVAPAKYTMAAWAKSIGVPDGTLEGLGFDPKAVGDTQALRALTAKAIIGQIGAGGFPANNFSDADRKFLEGTIPQLGSDPRANKIIIEVGRRSYQRDIEKAQAWNAFRKDPANKDKNGQVHYDEFELNWSDKVAKKDSFGDLQREAEDLIGSPGGDAGQAPVKVPTTRFKFNPATGKIE